MLIKYYRGNDDIINIGSSELKVIQELIYLLLDIWNKINKSYNYNIEYLLAAMADNSKMVLMQLLYQPLVEELTGINNCNVIATINHINNIFLYQDRVQIQNDFLINTT